MSNKGCVYNMYCRTITEINNHHWYGIDLVKYEEGESVILYSIPAFTDDFGLVNTLVVYFNDLKLSPEQTEKYIDICCNRRLDTDISRHKNTTFKRGNSMQFHITTDYAIRIALYLTAHQDELPTGSVIASEMGITYPFFIKVANALKEEGIINNVQGRIGGYYLNRPADKISLYDIIKVMEGDIRINRCLQDDGFCSRYATEHCPVHNVYAKVQSNLIKELSSVYLSDL